MSGGVSRVRTGLRVAVILAAGAVILASCGTTAVVVVAPEHVSGTPALSFAVPLTNVACTLNDVCVAIGSSSGGQGPTSVAEYSTPHGHWINLALPALSSTLLTTTACAGAQCLIGGSRPGSDLLWLFDSHGSALTALTPPAQGIGVSSLTCSTQACALIDTGPEGVPRFSMSTNVGTTWSTPQELAFAKGDAVTTFSCATTAACALGLMNPQHAWALYVTHDGGTTWDQQVTPSSWTTLTSLSCQQRQCVGLAATSTESLLVRTTTFGRKWKTTTLAQSAHALACTPLGTCVVVGERAGGAAWLATRHDNTTANVILRYVPSPLLDAACGSKICAAIGITTLVSIPTAT